MAKNAAVPSLDSSGWLEGISHKAERLFTYFLTSERSQSNIYPNISSLPYLLQHHSNKMNELVLACEEDIKALYGDYFDRVKVAVTAESGDDENNPRLDLRFNVRVTEGDKEYVLSQLIASSNGVISRIVNLNKPE